MQYERAALVSNLIFHIKGYVYIYLLSDIYDHEVFEIVIYLSPSKNSECVTHKMFLKFVKRLKFTNVYVMNKEKRLT